MANFTEQTFFPIRTNHASDLFFPTLIHVVLKTKGWAKNFFAVTLAIVWDLTTLPIRLITFFPRMIYNHYVKPQEHPLIPYLKSKGLAAIDVEGLPPFRLTTGGQEELLYEERNGRMNICLYKEEIKDGKTIREGEIYRLFLTDREIPFPTYGSKYFCSGSPAK